MALDPSNAKATLTADYDAVLAQLNTLRDEIAKLAGSVSADANRRGQALGKDISDGMTEARAYVGRKGHDADVKFEHAVAANPFMALGIAAGFGLMLGYLTRR